ncbi:DUF642 domain-containing protein [Corallococcus sp. CA053C]|uniref:DUF642 domain-containing protein n=1 Tax=Corallococcus sp. CA053C TaxID=2316732 RepID=UPI000EA14A17|nr:DUF642 domain-containing protein [Corallococcus sp. CA053C]RKG98600.1 DUF642 domain-containing protein [Corallococcus sp. CA053C]
MNRKQLLRRGTVLGLGFFALAGCGGTDAVIQDPDVASVEQGLNVATNGGFEANAIGNFNYVQLNAGSTALPPWTITGSIKVLKNPYKVPAGGVQSIDLNGSSAGSVTQYVPTVVGGGYTLSFYVSNSPGCTTVSRSMDIAYDTRTASTSNASATWSLRTYTFNATTTSTLIKLTSTSGGVGCGLAIDNLTVNGP